MTHQEEEPTSGQNRRWQNNWMSTGSNCPGTSGTIPEFQSKNLSCTETLISLLLSWKLCLAHESRSKHCYLHWHQIVQLAELTQHMSEKGKVKKALILPSKSRVSNGWLARFKFRHNIGAATLSREKASVDLLTVENWRERLLR